MSKDEELEESFKRGVPDWNMITDNKKGVVMGFAVKFGEGFAFGGGFLLIAAMVKALFHFGLCG